MYKTNGFTLIEIIIVTAILGIVTVIGLQSVNRLTIVAKEKVCDINRKQVGGLYPIYIESRGHSDALFSQFIEAYRLKLCPADGDFTYVEGEVKCNIHHDEEEEEAVPFL